MDETILTEYAMSDGYFNAKIKSYYRNMYVYGCLKQDEYNDKKDRFRIGCERMKLIGSIGFGGLTDQASRWNVSDPQKVSPRTSAVCASLISL